MRSTASWPAIPGLGNSALRCSALEQAKAIRQLTTILERGDWRAQASAAEAVARIAAIHKISDKPLSDALIAAAQSKTLQTQDAANKAVRALNRDDSVQE